MSDKVTGIVQKITKNKAYSVLVEEDWYGAGFNKPEFSEGYEIEFDVVMNGKYKNMANVVVLNDTPVAPTNITPAKASNKTSGGTFSKDSYWENKEQRDIRIQKEIRFQASRNTAVSFVQVLLESGAIASYEKAAATKKAGILEEVLNHYTNLFYNQTIEVSNSEDIYSSTKEEGVNSYE